MLSLKDRLSRLTYREACKFLGPEGGPLIRQGGKYEIDVETQVTWGDDLLRVELGATAVTFTLSPDSLKTLRFRCDTCTKACDHLGAAFSLILEEKLALGLSAPPPEKVPVESLSEKELVRIAIEERAERARTEKMTLKPADGKRIWADYTLTNRSSGKTYRVALRGGKGGILTARVRIFEKTPWEHANTFSMHWQPQERGSPNPFKINPVRLRPSRFTSATVKISSCASWSRTALTSGFWGFFAQS